MYKGDKEIVKMYVGETQIIKRYKGIIQLPSQSNPPAPSGAFAVFRADGSNAFNAVLVFPTENLEPLIIDWGDGSEPEAFYNNTKKKGTYAYFSSHDYTGIVQDCDITLSSSLADCVSIHLDNNNIISVNVSGLTALPELSLSYTAITTVDVSGLIALTQLNLEGCTSLTTPPDLTGLTALQNLFLSGCTSLTTPPDLTGLTALQDLFLGGCTSLTTPPDLTGLTALTDFVSGDCTSFDTADVDSVLSYFSVLRETVTYVDLYTTAIPTPATLLAAQTANPQCTFSVDT
jgi:hypothetical protein